ncbi:MAG: Undecaprenyl-phosphate 4-deoxy-4-formamido-L-arabinose transferase [Planctomycetes bacterium]|nr:Undecaprenyl-phosphate 4-deoxy-4-formamido-L-arabinose transferase [Planctomycetota bacterium]
MPDITFVLPARNESAGLPGVLERIHATMTARGRDTWEVVVVDDGSDDGTSEAAAKAGARVVRHPYSMGNGAAIKAGMRAAAGKTLVLMDADGQHAPEDVPRLLDALTGYAMVVGARTLGTGTGAHRGLANSVYNALASYVVGRKVEDLTSGFRAVSAEDARRFIYMLPNTFSYPTTITLAFFRSGLPVRYVPIEARKRVGKSHIRIVQDGVRFLLIILRIATLVSPLKVFMPASLSFLVAGLGWYAYTYSTSWRFTNGSLLAFTLAVILFALALISEQIAALRFDRSERER